MMRTELYFLSIVESAMEWNQIMVTPHGETLFNLFHVTFMEDSILQKHSKKTCAFLFFFFGLI